MCGKVTERGQLRAVRATPAEPRCVFQEAWARPRVGAAFPWLLRMGSHKRAPSPSGFHCRLITTTLLQLPAALTDPAVATRAPRSHHEAFPRFYGMWKRCLPSRSRQGGTQRAKPGRWVHEHPKGTGDAPSCLPSPFPNLGPFRSPCPTEIGAFQGCWVRIGLL